MGLSIVAILIGAIIGAATDEGTGVFIGALVGWLVVRSVRQQRTIDALQQVLREHEVGRAGTLPLVAAPVPASAPQMTATRSDVRTRRETPR